MSAKKIITFIHSTKCKNMWQNKQIKMRNPPLGNNSSSWNRSSEMSDGAFYYRAKSSSHHLSLNREGCWGIRDDFATSFLHFSLFSTALWDLLNSRPVHSLMLFSHLFLCLPCLLPPFTEPCKMVLARPDEQETRPYHCSLRFFMIIRRSSCGPIACWVLARTSSLVNHN